MKKLFTSIAVLALAIMSATPAYCLDRKGLAEYAKSLKGLKKEALKTKIYSISQPKTIIPTVPEKKTHGEASTPPTA